MEQIDPYRVEKLVAEVWKEQGYQTNVRTASGDRGIDVEAVKQEPFHQKVLIQVKRYTGDNKVGSEEVRSYSTLKNQESNADVIVLVTTGEFTTPAENLATDLNVKTVNGDDLAGLVCNNFDTLRKNFPELYSESKRESSIDRELEREEKTIQPDDEVTTQRSELEQTIGSVTTGSSWSMFQAGPARTGYHQHTSGPTNTGTTRWSFETGQETRLSESVDSSPAVADGVVYVGSTDGKVYALDAATGDTGWTFETDAEVRSSPAVADGNVYFGSGVAFNSMADSNVYALDAATGDTEWTFETTHGVFSSSAVADGTIYVGSTDGKVYALDAATGDQQWVFETGGDVYSSPAVADGTIYVGSYDSNVYALDAATGDRQWVFKTGDGGRSAPAVADGTVYVGSKDNNVYAVDAVTGDQKWVFRTGASVKSSPAVVDGVVYIGSFDSNLYALDAATGDQQWVFETGGAVYSSPAVADGIVYIGSADGNVYAVE